MSKKIKIKLIEDFHVKGKIKDIDLKKLLNNSLCYLIKKQNSITS